MQTFKDMSVIAFKSAAAWRTWLRKNHVKSTAIWLRIFKKHSAMATVAYAEALDEALCFGWIDSTKNKCDDVSFFQRFSARSAGSVWSKVNRERVARLTAQGKMEEAGLRAVEESKHNGQWDNAYDSPSQSTIPRELQERLNQDPRTKAFFESLNKVNRYAFCHRIQKTRTPDTRAKKIQWAFNRLKQGEKIY